MKKVYIKYNPYKLTTEITVDGKPPADNSPFQDKISGEAPFRLQEWVEEIPGILLDEYNDDTFDIEFYGLRLDYEDLAEVFEQAKQQGKLSCELHYIPAKDNADREALIDEVFQEITGPDCPIPGLCDAEMEAAFRQAKSSEFEVCVVATMSSGKSTLINAMLGTKLMPSKQEACTAIITRIQDTDDPVFRAEVYHKGDDLQGVPVEMLKELTYANMNRLNAEPEVSTIKVYGKIPFMDAGEISLVLIDTPGPNNSRDPSHMAVQQELLGKNSKALVLYIMTGEFGTNDDNTLLRRIAGSMSVGGKKSRDRFIFVVNKMDGRKKEDGDINQTLESIRGYLEHHGIYKPNLFPVAALPAMNIRRRESGELDDEDELDEVETKIKKLNRGLHLEEYAVLPPTLKGEINGALDTAQAAWEGEPKENPDTALIHTGVVSVEAAIRQYVRKYAKTAKIKNISDTFRHKLDEQKYMESIKKELATNKDEWERIRQQIAEIKEKMDSVTEAQKFETAVQDEVRRVNSDSKTVVKNIISEFQTRVSNLINAYRGRELSKGDAEYEVRNLETFAKKLEPEFEAELEDLIQNKLVATGNALMENYQKKLSLLAETEKGCSLNIRIDPLKMMSGSVGAVQVNNLVRSRQVEDGEEFVKNTNKKWYKPWTWFQEKGYYRTTHRTEEYVNAGELAQQFFAPLQRTLNDNGEAALKYAQEQSENIKESFKQEFTRLDGILREKLSELESYTSDSSRAEERVRETEEKLAWLNRITAKVDSILEI